MTAVKERKKKNRKGWRKEGRNRVREDVIGRERKEGKM